MTTIISEMPVAVPQQPRADNDAASTARSRIAAPRVEPRDSLTAKLLGAQKMSEAADGGATDLLIQGLVGRLPTANSLWSLEDRARWLRTAASVFDLVYKADDGERREIGVVFAKPETERPI
jgi:hypothetical protein